MSNVEYIELVSKLVREVDEFLDREGFKGTLMGFEQLHKLCDANMFYEKIGIDMPDEETEGAEALEKACEKANKTVEIFNTITARRLFFKVAELAYSYAFEESMADLEMFQAIEETLVEDDQFKLPIHAIGISQTGGNIYLLSIDLPDYLIVISTDCIVMYRHAPSAYMQDTLEQNVQVEAVDFLCTESKYNIWRS